MCIIQQILNQTLHHFCCRFLSILTFFKFFNNRLNLIDLLLITLKLHKVVEFVEKYLVLDTLSTNGIQRVPEFVGDGSVDKVKKLVVVLNLLALDAFSDVDELQHGCVLILFVQFCHFYAEKFKFGMLYLFEHYLMIGIQFNQI